MQLRRPPHTPNLEQMKLKAKSKSKRKTQPQPTNPPTPKPHKAQIFIKPNNNKFGQFSRLNEDNICQNHPDRIATHTFGNPSKRLCNKCLQDESLNDDETMQQNQIEKRRQLDSFKGKIKGFGLKLQEASSSYEQWSNLSDKNFYQQKEYINQTFDTIKSLVEEKKRELINELMKKQQLISQSLHDKNTILENIKSSMNRYIQDIDNNYDDIIESLSFKQFEEIIRVYNKKMEYFEAQLESIYFENTINVYIPQTQIKKHILLSEVENYFPQQQKNKSFKVNTMQRQNTQKHHLCINQLPQQPPNRSQYTHQSLNKFNQQRKSHNKQYYNSKEINQFRNCLNKQNLYYDNYC